MIDCRRYGLRTSEVDIVYVAAGTRSPPNVVTHAQVLEVAVVLEHVDRQVQGARFS